MLSDCVVMYEFVMARMASELANMGEYQLATQLDDKILKESLKYRRIASTADILYDLAWNKREQDIKAGGVPNKEKMTETLNQCVILSHFCKLTYDKSFYMKKMCQE